MTVIDPQPAVTASNDTTDPTQLQSAQIGVVDSDGESGNQHTVLSSSWDAGGLNPELANRWLVWQCKMIADVISASLYSCDGELLAIWPTQADGQDVLEHTASLAIENNQPVIKTEMNFGSSGSRIGDALACPINAASKPIAYVSVLMTPRPQSRQNAVLQLIQWSGYWLESLSQLSDGIHQEAASFTQSLLTSVLTQNDSQKIAMEITNRLATRLSCERVSFGAREGLVVKLKSISGLASYDSRTQLVRGLEAAMEECLDSAGTITLPQLKETSAPDKAHRDLLAQHDMTSICSVPLPGCRGAYGAIVLERNAAAPFDTDVVHWVETVMGIAAPILELKQFEERPLWQKTVDTARRSLTELLGPKWLRTRIVAGVVSSVLLFGALFNGTHEVRAPAHVTGDVSQVVAAPLAGFIKSAEVRAGDTVTEGQLLANLDDRSLQLELKKWQSERNKTAKAYQEALAKRARTELSILRAKTAQIDAELALTKQQIDRTQLRAPFNGYIVSGDLNQSLGAPVEIGDLLFEVAPLQQYRVVLQVSERDMAGVTLGQSGQIRIAATPGDQIPFIIEQIVPLAVADQKGSYFRVEAKLQQELTALRPGMEGVARITMGKRKRLWIWTHKITDRLRMWFWSIGW